MKVINIHERIINESKSRIWELFETLSSDHDMVVATNKWPRMIMDSGLKVGSKGGHGPIGYTILEFRPAELIKFKFTKPSGFEGFHQFGIAEIEKDKTKLTHTIEMNASVKGSILWTCAIRWLHDAFIEDSFDKVENHFSPTKKFTEWNVWVKFLRRMLRPKKH